jgi:EAL domain-containing protein (putative c-di-GMP-specific phosphodiesterase class I)
VIEAVLAIAQILELSVVAEGIETDEQLEFVRSRGCDAAQGFLMARPMPIADAERVIFGHEPGTSLRASDDTSSVRSGASGSE